MVLAYHTILSAYGFWLPNDPRGSWSDFVRAWELRRFGPATKVDTRQSVAGVKHDRGLRAVAKRSLKYPPVVFTGVQARAVANGFAKAVTESKYRVLACAILPEHVHLVVARHKHTIEQIVAHVKGRATQRLKEDGLWSDDPEPRSPWEQDSWDVYLDSEEAIERAVRYVERNPEKEGKRRQSWAFVTPYR